MKSCLTATLLSAFAITPDHVPYSPIPSAAEQMRVLDNAKKRALDLGGSLPDYVCTETTRRFETFEGNHWRQLDVIVNRFTSFHHIERYEGLSLNGNPPTVAQERLGSASSSGEFGSLMKEIFVPRTEAEFAWQSWTNLRGRKLQVYSYRVRAFRSKYHIDATERSLDLVAAYHGLVFIDGETKFVYRITIHFDGIPEMSPIRDINILQDYDQSRIGDEDYLLPLQFELSWCERDHLVKNQVHFGSCQELQAASSIKYDSEDVR